jgi:hypothetical protein
MAFGEMMTLWFETLEETAAAGAQSANEMSQ